MLLIRARRPSRMVPRLIRVCWLSKNVFVHSIRQARPISPLDRVNWHRCWRIHSWVTVKRQWLQMCHRLFHVVSQHSILYAMLIELRSSRRIPSLRPCRIRVMISCLLDRVIIPRLSSSIRRPVGPCRRCKSWAKTSSLRRRLMQAILPLCSRRGRGRRRRQYRRLLQRRQSIPD